MKKRSAPGSAMRDKGDIPWGLMEAPISPHMGKEIDRKGEIGFTIAGLQQTGKRAFQVTCTWNSILKCYR